MHVSEIIARPRGIIKLGVGSKGVRWKKYTHQTALHGPDLPICLEEVTASWRVKCELRIAQTYSAEVSIVESGTPHKGVPRKDQS